MGVHIETVPASMLESRWAGEPARLVKETYLKAAKRQQEQLVPCAVLVNDLHFGIGRFQEYASGTVNTRHTIAAFTELSDNPHMVLEECCDRVPVFATTNSTECLNGAIVRPGRCAVMRWEPTREQTLSIARHILREYSLTEAQFSMLSAQTAEFSPAHFGMLKSRLRGFVIARALGNMDAKASLCALLRGEVQIPQSATVSSEMLEEAIEAVRKSAASTQLDFTKGGAV